MMTTGDDKPRGRCWFALVDKTGRKPCPRHGDVTEAVEAHIETGKLTREKL